MRAKSSNIKATTLEDQVDIAWKEYSLDAPRIPNPIPGATQGLRNMCIVVHLVLPIAKIIVGARYIHSCPTDPWLPTYVLIGGMLQLIFLIVLVYRPLRKPSVLSALGLIILVWILTASVNTFVEWKPDFFLGGWRYCNKVLFFFAFFVSLSEYVIISILILYVCTQFAYSRVDRSTSSQIV